MSRKMVVAAACAALSLMPFAPARANVVPTELQCTASGSADYWGDWEGSDSWSNIVATGLCVGKGPDPFTVMLTGEGTNAIGDGLRLNLVLTNTFSGRSATYRQTWWNGVPRSIIQASTGVPCGLGRILVGRFDDSGSSQQLGFAWTFLAFQTP
jgi:hypothetical protein